MPDVPASVSTTATLSVGVPTINLLDAYGDHDWFAINLTAGVQVTVTIYGITLEDPFLNVRNSSGTVIGSNDDIVDGVNRNSKLTFTPTTSGTYYIDVGAYNDLYAGSYQVSVDAGTQKPLGLVDTIAGYLVQGSWSGEFHHFAVSQGGSISVNISTLNPAEQNLARTALQEWSDVIGVTFNEVATGAQITFDHSESGSDPVAETDATFADGITASANVHISTSWVNSYGTALNSYSFETYLHEIGHALGLGHSGDYNGTATFSTDALFRNDAWSTTVMSYFDQNENNYFDAQGFTRAYAVTPMQADIAAMQTLYGLSTTTRTGNTTYGFNSTAGGVFNANAYPDVAVTIYDSAGTDTMDYSGSSANQLLSLNPETFSNVNGRIGNLSIGRGVIIENAIGGSGADTLIGNGVANFLNGGGGNDSIEGGDGNDTLEGGAGNDFLVGGAGADILHGGAGVDTAYYYNSTTMDLIGSLSAGDAAGDSFDSIEIIRLSGFNDIFEGSVVGDIVALGAGNDVADGHNGDDLLYGEEGDDLLSGGTGNDTLHGGAGTDSALYLFVSGGVLVELDAGRSSAYWGNAGNDTLYDIENARGSAYDDVLIGTGTVNDLNGGGGNDVLYGETGADTLTGGAGADRFLYVNQIDSNPGASDRIMDFESGVDKIDLRQAQAGRSVSWSLSTSGTDTVLSVDFGSNGSIDMRILLSGNKTVVASDLMLTSAMAAEAAPMLPDSHLDLLGSSAPAHADLFV